MEEIGIRDLKTHASEIVQAVRETKAHYIVTHRGKPVAVILPLEEAPPEGKPSDAWDELSRLGARLSEGWKSEQTSADLLSEMRK